MNGSTQPREKEEEELSKLVSSIERSRKRHLSIGLLRGDLVHDRLREQEVTASPQFKKPKATTADEETRSPPNTPGDPPPEAFLSPLEHFSTPPREEEDSNMALTMADFKAYMDANTNKTLAKTNEKLETVERNLAGMRTTVTEIDRAVKSNTKRLDDQADNIKANNDDIKKMRAELDDLRTAPMKPTTPGAREQWPLPSTRSSPASPTRTTAQEADFHKARRSLRLWPISGDNKDDLWHAAGLFLGTNLGLQGKLDKNNIEAITRVSVPSGPGVKEEALVLFNDKATRDMVLGSAAKLGRYIGEDGKPTAGMRIEVPAHLQRDFRILFKYGQGLRTRHGLGTRRHVKFCDDDHSLFLNVKLPGDETWGRISLQMARRGLRARTKLSEGKLEKRMDITGTPLDRPRPASTSSATASRSTPGTSVWTTRRPESTST